MAFIVTDVGVHIQILGHSRGKVRCEEEENGVLLASLEAEEKLLRMASHDYAATGNVADSLRGLVVHVICHRHYCLHIDVRNNLEVKEVPAIGTQRTTYCVVTCFVTLKYRAGLD